MFLYKCFHHRESNWYENVAIFQLNLAHFVDESVIHGQQARLAKAQANSA